MKNRMKEKKMSIRRKEDKIINKEKRNRKKAGLGLGLGLD